MLAEQRYTALMGAVNNDGEIKTLTMMLLVLVHELLTADASVWPEKAKVTPWPLHSPLRWGSGEQTVSSYIEDRG